MTIQRPAIVPAVALFVLLLPSVGLAQFDTPNRSFHDATGFRLEGKHLSVDCEACHLNGQYQATPTTCFACHWQRRRDDPYETRLGVNCEQCHRPVSWTAVRWDHAGQAGVPLNIDHRLMACESCHTDRTFSGVAVNCVSCHQRDFAATTAPNHLAAGFPTACASCHRPGDSTWQSTGGAGFDHNAVFPLVGVHALQPCEGCHKNNVYQGTPRECVGCHQADYTRTTNPNHAAAGFPTTCDSCHRPTDTAWQGAGGSGFNHNAAFPLLGVHATQACAACHVNNVYQGTPRDCVGCHLNQYNATTSPNHIAAGFPTTCEACHRATDTSFTQGTFVHGWFPLSGPHNRPCSDCHTIPNNFAQFSCTVCHGRTETDGHHHGISGYVYESTACYACHPNGRH